MLTKCWLQGNCSCAPRVDEAAQQKVPSASAGTVFDGTDSIAALLDFLRVDASITSAVIKLNLCEYRDWTSGATTSPLVVEAIVGALRDRCRNLQRIVLLEQDSSGTRATDLYALLGFSELAEQLGLELFIPAEATWRHVDDVGELPIEVPELVYEVDLFVNVPKMKLHGKTIFTGALKNNFGLVRRKWKLPYHARLCETIVASNLHLPRQLCIMDGTVVLSGRGPAYGVPVNSGVILGSWDPVAIDAAGARFSGVPVVAAGHVRIARRAGLGTSSGTFTWLGAPSGPERPRADWLRMFLANALRQA